MSKTSTRATNAASALLSVALASSAALLIGCGQRGPLYLPASQQATPSPTAPAASAPR